MQIIKDTGRAQVARNFSGSVIKTFSGPNRTDRFQNEVRVLQHLNALGCPFVPKLISHDSQSLKIATSYVGEPVQSISAERLDAIFDELSEFCVRHDDPAQRNILYNHSLGRFTVIDFEFAEILTNRPSESNEQLDERFERLESLLEVACND